MELYYADGTYSFSQPVKGYVPIYLATDVQALAKRVLDNATYASLKGVEVFEELRAIVEGK